MKSPLRTCAFKTIALSSLLGAALLQAQPIGQWDFNSTNLSATVGSDLEYLDGVGGETALSTQFGATTALGIPDIGGQPAQVMRFSTNVAPRGYKMRFTSAPNGGGGFVNQWTIVFDVLYPSESAAKLRPLIETDNRAIAADADFFVSPTGGIGVNGQFQGQIQTNTWYRVGFVVDASASIIRKYINGALVGSQSAANGATPALDGRWALDPATGAELFNDDDAEGAVGYVNSIQLRNVALSSPQMQALGGPSAAGIPQQIPSIPSFVEKWIPNSATASRNTDIGVVINAGDTTIQDSSITLKLDSATLASPQITRNGTVITVVKPNPQLFTPGTPHTIEVSYTDSLAGQKTFTRQFNAAVFFEDFEGITLGPNVDEALAGVEVWTNAPPAGWIIDKSGVPGIADPATDGVTEWAGWSFANRDWWATTAGGQDREQFLSASGTVAIADPDEWDDKGHDVGMYNTFLSTPTISLVGIPANTLVLKFNSSVRSECCDDNPDLDNSQTETVTISYNGGAEIEVLKWDSTTGSPTYKADNVNETVILNLSNAPTATNIVLKFGLTRAENDWWWAIDNIELQAGALAPTITTQPQSQFVFSGASPLLSVRANGTSPFFYRWQFNDADIAGATSSNLTIANFQSTNAGNYRAIVTNIAGSATSIVARLEYFSGSITQDLVAHLKFDNSLTDSTGRGNDGTAVGSPTFATGKIGANAVHIPSGTDYVSLGAPADLNFGTDTDFSISFWTRVVAWNSDPSFIGNKDWDSGGNTGYVLATEDDGRLQWNMAGPPGTRKDFDGPGGTFTNADWHHVVVSYDRQGNAFSFVDGALVDSRSMNANQNNLDTPAGFATNIGQDGTGTYGPAFTDMDMDDLGIWRRVLTSQEVAGIYAKGQAGQDLSTATGATAPVNTAQPQSFTVSPGANVVLSVATTGSVPQTYQWKLGVSNVSGATAATLNLNGIQASQAGDYTVVVSNAGGSATSAVARVDVFTGPVTQDLVVHLKFDNNLSDASGRGNNGVAVGAPTFVAGKVGANAVHIPSGVDYVNLGTPADLNFGTNTDFSVAFWANLRAWGGDPSFIANKDWDSGNNRGWVIATDSDGRIQWNLAGKPDATTGDRKDFDGPGGTFTSNVWRHVVVTFDRSGNAITFVDGVQLAHRNGAQVIPIATPPNDLSTPAGLATRIGQDGVGDYGSVFTDADMDDLGIWRRVITPQEVAAIYGAGQVGNDLSNAAVGSAGPRINSVAQSGSTLVLGWNGQPGLRLQKTTSLTSPDWPDVPGTDGASSATETIAGNSAFYRLFKP
jgi:hypothetical protein